ncbi:MAG: hypothetical protein HQL52_15605 [Magnetococcales bacterium]|nr:hypothetical protein [Magnetococcales bacterium]
MVVLSRRFCVFLLFIAMTLPACGYRGNLYLPETATVEVAQEQEVEKQDISASPDTPDSSDSPDTP